MSKGPGYKGDLITPVFIPKKPVVSEKKDESGLSSELKSYLKLANQYNIESRNWSAKQAQNQMDFQKMMSDTAHQREVADLKAAGLNPVLSAGGNGASSAAGAAAQDSGAMTAVVNELMGVVQQQNELNYQREKLDRQEKLDRERFDLEKEKFGFESAIERERLELEKLKANLSSSYESLGGYLSDTYSKPVATGKQASNSLPILRAEREMKKAPKETFIALDPQLAADIDGIFMTAARSIKNPTLRRVAIKAAEKIDSAKAIRNLSSSKTVRSFAKQQEAVKDLWLTGF